MCYDHHENFHYNMAIFNKYLRLTLSLGYFRSTFWLLKRLSSWPFNWFIPPNMSQSATFMNDKSNFDDCETESDGVDDCEWDQILGGNDPRNEQRSDR
jgi:hypothetical protein